MVTMNEGNEIFIDIGMMMALVRNKIIDECL